MRYITKATRDFFGGAFLGVLLAGCVTPPPVEKEPPPPSVNLARDTIIIVSSEAPAFMRASDYLLKKIHPKLPVYNIRGSERLGATAIKEIQRSNRPLVVAIGLPAAIAARKLTGKKVVFCQVFNYADHGLVTPWMKGVSAIPSAHEQFRAWKRLSPRLSSVGMITGRNLDDLAAEARTAARRHKIKLTHVTVKSDKEMLYAYKRLLPKIQGLWLAPDNRVLSNEVIREVMSYSVRHGKQVLVFNPELLKLGGILSIESDAADIAEQVIMRLRMIAMPSADTTVDVAPLTRFNAQVNPVVLKRFGLKLPRGFEVATDVR